MARVALALVVLGHERERVPVRVGDLLGTVLVDGVVVGHREGVRVPEVHLVLAEVALALRVLDADVRARHAEPDRADHVLDHRRPQDRVVDVVRVRRDQVVVALLAGRVVGLAEQEELELGADVGDQPALGEPVELAAQDLPRRRRHRPAVLPLDVADDERRLLEPRDAPERRHVGVEDEVAVAGLPRRHLEPLHRHHVDVDREQVVAPLRAVRRDLVAEEGCVQALALEPALHVGHDEEDGVDLAALNVGAQLLEGQRHAPFIYCDRYGPQAAGHRDQRL